MMDYQLKIGRMLSMKRGIYILLFGILALTVISACSKTDKVIEENLGQAEYPLPQVVSPGVAPVAEAVMESTDEVLKERTLKDTTRPGKKGGYRATLFPKSDSETQDGTAFKLSW